MLDQELDLVMLFGSLVVVRAKKDLLSLIHYVQTYSAEDLYELWQVVSAGLSNAERRWVVQLLQESVDA